MFRQQTFTYSKLTVEIQKNCEIWSKLTIDPEERSH